MFQHTLRASPYYAHETLTTFDQLLSDGLSKICNISLPDNQWLQVSLHVDFGGLGIRRVSSLAFTTFLASTVATRDLQDQILYTDLLSPYSDLDRYRQLWHDRNGQVQSLTSPAEQQTWDKPIVERELS